MIGLEKSFPMMYSNIGLNSCETVPLKGRHCFEIGTLSVYIHIRKLTYQYVISV